jgi:hypothetical protein
MAETTAKLETGKSRVQDAGERAQDYLDRATQTASSGMERVSDTARRTVDTAAESAKAGLDWASDKASVLRERNAADGCDRYRCGDRLRPRAHHAQQRLIRA